MTLFQVINYYCWRRLLSGCGAATCAPSPRLSRKQALSRAEGAPLRLEGYGADTARGETVPDVVHTADGRDGVAREPRLAPTGPEDLSERSGTGPELGLDVVGVRLLGP